MSLPRVLTLRNGELRMQAAPQIARLRSADHESKNIHEWTASFERSAIGGSTQHLKDHLGPVVAVRYDTARDPRTLDLCIRHEGQEEHTTVPMLSDLPDKPKLHVFVDKSVLEIFVDDRFCYTHRFYSRDPAVPLATLTLPGHWVLADLQTFTLNAIWHV